MLGLVIKGLTIHKMPSKLTLIETFKLDGDIDLEHSNPIFSVDTSLVMMIYHYIEFGCKRLICLKLIKDIVETVIFWLYKPTLWPWPWRQNHSFFAWHSDSWGCTTIPSLVTKGDIQTLSQLVTNMCRERYIPHPRSHHSTFPFVVK